MLRTLVFDPANPVASAAAIQDAWGSALIIHLRAAGPVPDVRASYGALLSRIGRPHFHGEAVQLGGRDAQRTGGIWSEVRFDPSFPDAYRHSTNAQPLHTDASYLSSAPKASLMCCVRNDVRGGETIFISSDDVVAALRDERPELLQALTSTPMPHARSGDRRVLPVIRRQDDAWLLNWNYYCVSNECELKTLALREAFFSFLRGSQRIRDALVEVRLGPGDAVLWDDQRLLHGRKSFVAQEISARYLWKCCLDVVVPS